MKNIETKYRLRKQEKIVGYMRKMGHNSLFYSRDQFWWNGQEIPYDRMDEATGMCDLNNRQIYEMDIVEYSMGDGRNLQGVVLWSRAQKTFIIRDLHNPALNVPLMVEDLELFEPQDLKFKSFLFINPELMVELGVTDN